MAIIVILMYLGFIALMLASQWKIFEKAGQPGWASLIPFYNIHIYLQIIQKPNWWILLVFIPFVNIIIFFLFAHELSKAFGKDGTYTLGLIFLGFIFFPLLAFGDARYQYSDDPDEQYIDDYVK